MDGKKSLQTTFQEMLQIIFSAQPPYFSAYFRYINDIRNELKEGEKLFVELNKRACSLLNNGLSRESAFDYKQFQTHSGTYENIYKGRSSNPKLSTLFSVSSHIVNLLLTANKKNPERVIRFIDLCAGKISAETGADFLKVYYETDFSTLWRQHNNKTLSLHRDFYRLIYRLCFCALAVCREDASAKQKIQPQKRITATLKEIEKLSEAVTKTPEWLNSSQKNLFESLFSFCPRGYTSNREFNIHDLFIPVELSGPIGQKCLITAPSGAGKTLFLQAVTLANIYNSNKQSRQPFYTEGFSRDFEKVIENMTENYSNIILSRFCVYITATDFKNAVEEMMENGSSKPESLQQIFFRQYTGQILPDTVTVPYLHNSAQKKTGLLFVFDSFDELGVYKNDAVNLLKKATAEFGNDSSFIVSSRDLGGRLDVLKNAVGTKDSVSIMPLTRTLQEELVKKWAATDSNINRARVIDNIEKNHIYRNYGSTPHKLSLLIWGSADVTVGMTVNRYIQQNIAKMEQLVDDRPISFRYLTGFLACLGETISLSDIENRIEQHNESHSYKADINRQKLIDILINWSGLLAPYDLSYTDIVFASSLIKYSLAVSHGGSRAAEMLKKYADNDNIKALEEFLPVFMTRKNNISIGAEVLMSLPHNISEQENVFKVIDIICDILLMRYDLTLIAAASVPEEIVQAQRNLLMRIFCGEKDYGASSDERKDNLRLIRKTDVYRKHSAYLGHKNQL